MTVQDAFIFGAIGAGALFLVTLAIVTWTTRAR